MWPLHEDIAELQLRWWQCSGSNLAVAGESGSASEAEAAATEVIVFVAEENVIVENSGKASEEGNFKSISMYAYVTNVCVAPS